MRTLPRLAKGQYMRRPWLAQSIRAFHEGESGQVTFLFAFASIALVLLIGFMLNTARQTSRKIEMQGAADSAAIAGSIWMARGMNLMVLNNKGMADLLSVMITVRSAVQTTQAMIPIVSAMAAAAAAFPPTEELAVQFGREVNFYRSVHSALAKVDQELSDSEDGRGWQLMRQLDDLNQTLKGAVPAVAEAQALIYGRANGADGAPYAVLIGGGEDSVPLFPVGRGGEQFVAKQAQECALPRLSHPTILALEAACLASPASPCITPLMASLVFDQAVEQNVLALSERVDRPRSTFRITRNDLLMISDHEGRSLQDMVDAYNAAHTPQGGKGKPKATEDMFNSPQGQELSRLMGSFSADSPMAWPSHRPMPMMLTDDPQREEDAQIRNPQAPIDLLSVRKHLQFLAFARGRKNAVAIGVRYFTNPAPYGWLTYGEADVYNPADWWMFNQHWEARLASSTLLNEKFKLIAGILGLTGDQAALTDLSFVNTH